MNTIDIHPHVFNAADIPIEGFISRFIPVPGMAKLVAWLIRVIGQREGFLADPLIETNEITEFEKDLLIHQFLAEHPDLQLELEEVAKSLYQEDETTELIPTWLVLILGRNIINWVLVMLGSQKAAAEFLLRTYPEVGLFTPLLMDMDYWVNDESENSIDQQIQIHGDLIKEFPGRLHPFVSYCPRREIKEGGALDRVKDAITHRGFIGVKIYPPMGFRASGNTTDDHGNEAKALNVALEKFFSWAADEQVPITAHCTPEGAEANPGAGANSNPIYWEPVLAAHPALILNLGHFGGVENLMNPGDQAAWSDVIHGMMKLYPNLYADVGHHGVHKRSVRNFLAEKLGELFRAENSVLATRLMYGSDWHMIVRVRGASKFLRRYSNIFEKALEGTNGTVSNLMSANAAAFLGLESEHKNSERIKSWYLANNLSFPTWLET